MITKESLELIHEAIKEYDKLVNKDYLIACNSSKNQPTEYIVLRINRHNFWHLLGCKVIKHAGKNKEVCKDIYAECFNQKDIAGYVEYTHTAQDLKMKYTVFMNIFDFVKNARSVRICKTEDTPEYYQFKIAVGHYKGIIGYDYENKSLSILYPKTTQNKSIASFNSNASKKILYILSKNIDETSYDNVEFTPSKSTFKKLILELPDTYCSSIKQWYKNEDQSEQSK